MVTLGQFEWVWATAIHTLLMQCRCHPILNGGRPAAGCVGDVQLQEEGNAAWCAAGFPSLAAADTCAATLQRALFPLLQPRRIIRSCFMMQPHACCKLLGTVLSLRV